VDTDQRGGGTGYRSEGRGYWIQIRGEGVVDIPGTHTRTNMVGVGNLVMRMPMSLSPW